MNHKPDHNWMEKGRMELGFKETRYFNICKATLCLLLSNGIRRTLIRQYIVIPAGFYVNFWRFRSWMCCVEARNNFLPIIVLNNYHIRTPVFSSEGVVCVFKSYFLETYFNIFFVNKAEVAKFILINVTDKASPAVARENIGVGV